MCKAGYTFALNSSVTQRGTKGRSEELPESLLLLWMSLLGSCWPCLSGPEPLSEYVRMFLCLLVSLSYRPPAAAGARSCWGKPGKCSWGFLRNTAVTGKCSQTVIQTFSYPPRTQKLYQIRLKKSSNYTTGKQGREIKHKTQPQLKYNKKNNWKNDKIIE